MHLDRSAVQRDGVDLDPDDLSMLHALEHAIQDTGLRPAAPARIDGMPATKAFWQAAPFAALLGNVQDGIRDLKVRETDVAALARQAVLNLAILLFGDLQAERISQLSISVNTP